MCTYPTHHNTLFGLLYSNQLEGEYNHLALASCWSAQMTSSRAASHLVSLRLSVFWKLADSIGALF